jgi:hypothetical protein
VPVMTGKDPADKSFDEKRHDQLTTAPKADEGDAAPRVTKTRIDGGVTRIDIADTAAVRPGKPEDRT